MEEHSTLYIVGTPIGNLEDLTIRARKILSEVDFVVCEDTRVAGKLLSFCGSQAQKLVIHAHSDIHQFVKVAEILISGKNVCYLTDAGTPGISDPGNELVAFILENVPNTKVIPLPGVSSVTSLLSVAGVNTQKFTFLGFFPKSHHSRFVEEIRNSSGVVVYFDSPHRIIKNLAELVGIVPEKTYVVVGRELTKVHETIYRGDISNVLNQLQSESHLKGELTVLLQWGE